MPVREMRRNAQGALTPTATYLNGPRGPEYRRDDTQTEGTYTDGAGHTQIAGKTRWYVYDGLGSVVGEVDPGGNLTSSGTFDVYGAKRAGGTGTATSWQGFVGALGHVTDAETGLVYMRARYYDPDAGRFVNGDPAKHGRNWFNYCDGNPVNEIDRTGKDGDILPTIGSMDISATLDGIGSDFAVELEGAVQDMAGVLNNDAAFDVKAIESAEGIASGGDWGYYAKELAGVPGQFLKCWVRYNAQEMVYDYYLNADAGEIFAHATPYVGEIFS